MRGKSAGLLLSCALTISATAQTQQHFDGQSWWNHIKILADDKLEGRDTGSAGERAAQAYAVEQLKAAGAEPAGVDGYYQSVKFSSHQIVEKECSLALVRDGKREPLVLGDDAFISSRILPAPHVKAGLVFVGYGLKIPENNYDDFAEVDVKGKIAVVFSGSPAEIPAALASHYQSLKERWATLKAAGAIGMVGLINPTSMDIPWSRISLNRTHPTMDLDYPEFDETAGAQLYVTVNPASAEKFFAGSGHTFAEVAALGKDRKAMPHFALPATIEAHTKVEVSSVKSANLVAKLPGSDPALKDEYVVLSAHLDHVGIGAPINGDNIYNGAMDNATGCGMLLELARAFAGAPYKAHRSIFFAVVTAEEQGLLGSEYLGKHPPIPAGKISLDLNYDDVKPLGAPQEVQVAGAERTSFYPVVQALATEFRFTIRPDARPEAGHYYRSDHFSLARVGIPAFSINEGMKFKGHDEAWGLAQDADYTKNRYHQPTDEYRPGMDYTSNAAMARFGFALGWEAANQSATVGWKKGDEFEKARIAGQ